MLKNENPYSFHLWYLQTLFLFTAVTFLKDKFLSEKYARRAAILLILSLPAFYTLFCRDWIWVFKGFFPEISLFPARDAACTGKGGKEGWNSGSSGSVQFRSAGAGNLLFAGRDFMTILI